MCTRLQELAKSVEIQSGSRIEDLEIVKRTAPGAFQNRRDKAHGDDTSDLSSSCSTFRSSSMEDVNSESSLSVPDKPNKGHVSPMLDLRKKMQSQRIGESSDEETGSSNTRTKKFTPRTADSKDFTKMKQLPKSPRVTKMPMHRLSTSSLVHDGSLQNFDEIYMVAKALVFDLDTFDEGDDVDNPGGVVQVGH